MSNNVDLKLLKKMFKYGSLMIESEYEYINELNVFPVPDGDTGTNMKITTANAFAEINDTNFNSLYELAKTFSRALLMNARGNSGVIFSQIIKGFVSLITVDQKSLNSQDFKLAFAKAKTTAYSSVSNPVEGTILTIIRIISEEIFDINEESICSLFKAIYKIAKKALNETPNLLPQLKTVGVVDSGGYGLVKFIEGMKIAVCGEELPISIANDENKKNVTKALVNHYDVEEGFGYCSEIILKLGSKIEPNDLDKKDFSLDKFKKELQKIGDSLVLVQDEDIVKCHIHTKTPNELLSLGQKYGEFVKIKIENMTEQFYERLANDGIDVLDDNKFVRTKALKKFSSKIEIIHTVPNKQIAKILKDEYGFKHFLVTNKGNPSIKDILELLNEVSSSKIIFVTDDTNIVLAAKQAAATLKGKVDMRIIPASNIVESLIISLEFEPIASLDANEKKMNKALKNTITGLISSSIKDVQYDDIEIKKNDTIAILNKKIIAANSDEFLVICSLIDKMIKKTENADVAIIFKGHNANDSTIDKLEEYLLLKYDVVSDVKDSDQKIYKYIIGIQ